MSDPPLRLPELSELEALVVAARTGSIASAARELRLTPPAIAKRIRNLDTLAGERLLDRSEQGVRPTTAGRAMIEAAARLLADAEALVTRRRRVLVVDDDRTLLDGLEDVLHRRFDVVSAESAEDALDILRGGTFDVLVSDLRLPALSGLALLAAAREEAPDTVRVLLTGHLDLNTAVAAVNEGNVFRFLLKPCPAETLLRTIDEALAHRDVGASGSADEPRPQVSGAESA